MLKLGKFNKSAKGLLEKSFKSIYERDKRGRTVLHYAVDAKTVRLLVEKGANVNAADARGHTALHLAVTEKRLETVRELIKSGANVNDEEYGNIAFLIIVRTGKTCVYGYSRPVAYYDLFGLL